MTCPQCTAAESDPTRNEFGNGCRSCDARALAVTRADLLPREDYRDAVRKVFGDAAKDGHELVKAWLAKLRQAEASTATSGGAR